MESFAVDVDPAQIDKWLRAQERAHRRDYSIYAVRSYSGSRLRADPGTCDS